MWDVKQEGNSERFIMTNPRFNCSLILAMRPTKGAFCIAKHVEDGNTRRPPNVRMFVLSGNLDAVKDFVDSANLELKIAREILILEGLVDSVTETEEGDFLTNVMPLDSNSQDAVFTTVITSHA